MQCRTMVKSFLKQIIRGIFRPAHTENQSSYIGPAWVALAPPTSLLSRKGEGGHKVEKSQNYIIPYPLLATQKSPKMQEEHPIITTKPNTTPK